MSGIELKHCELPKIDSCNTDYLHSNSTSMASEVLNDIVENAIDLATKREKYGACMVRDLKDAYTPRAVKITDLCDVPKENQSKNLTSTEEEVKKFIKEINSPTSPKGTGDGTSAEGDEEIITKRKSKSSRNFSLERKSRLTNLVKSSKSVISKFLSSENPKKNENEWEENSEKFVKAIELDQGKRKIKESTSQSEIDQIGETMMINEKNMENIDLNDTEDPVTDIEEETPDYMKKSLTLPIASCSKITSTQQQYDAAKEKKKWHFGSKLANYIKKKTSRKDITKSDC